MQAEFQSYYYCITSLLYVRHMLELRFLNSVLVLPVVEGLSLGRRKSVQQLQFQLSGLSSGGQLAVQTLQ